MSVKKQYLSLLSFSAGNAIIGGVIGWILSKQECQCCMDVSAAASLMSNSKMVSVGLIAIGVVAISTYAYGELQEKSKSNDMNNTEENDDDLGLEANEKLETGSGNE